MVVQNEAHFMKNTVCSFMALASCLSFSWTKNVPSVSPKILPRGNDKARIPIASGLYASPNQMQGNLLIPLSKKGYPTAMIPEAIIVVQNSSGY